MHIYLQHLVSIQPRTSPPKICKIILEKLMLPILLIQASGEPQFLLAPTTTAGPTENPGDAEPFADYPDSEHSAAS